MGNGKNYPESDVYVRLDPSDAFQAKKDLLEVTAAIINMQMINNRIKQSGKIEVRQRAEAKASIKSMNAILGHLMSELPKIKTQKAAMDQIESEQDSVMHNSRKKVKATKDEKEVKSPSTKPKKMSLNEELLEIKRKLDSLK